MRAGLGRVLVAVVLEDDGFSVHKVLDAEPVPLEDLDVVFVRDVFLTTRESVRRLNSPGRRIGVYYCGNAEEDLRG